MRKAIIIADYGKETGAGHLMRCGALAKELSSDFNVTFVCENNEYKTFVSGVAKSNGADVKTVAHLWRLSDDIEADVLIVDSSNINMSFLTGTKNAYDVCVVIDDNNTLPFYDADILINQNIGAEKREYRARKDTLMLLGTKYLMLSENFVNLPPIDISKEVRNIAITMGGTDVKNTTEKILKLLQSHSGYVYNVVVGAGFAHSERLHKYENDNVILHYNVKMAELLSDCQGAISACGSTIYELAALGIPTIGVITSENQNSSSINMEDAGILFCAGLEEKLSATYFDILFNDITVNKEARRIMHERQSVAVVRDGVTRIKECIISKLI